MKLKRRILAVLLCAVMVASVLPMGVLAADSEYLTNDYDIYLPFDDAVTEQVKTYFNKHASGSHLTYEGNTGTGVFSTYVTEEDGNKYVWQKSYTNSGYAVRNAAGYDNFGGWTQISFRFMLESNGSTLTGATSAATATSLYIPVIRSSNSSNKTSDSGYTNLLVVANTGKYKGEAKTTDGTKYRIGYLIPGVDSTTTYTHTGYAIMSDTWYDVTFLGNHETGKCGFSVTDGSNYYDCEWTHSGLKGHDIFNQFTLFRTFSSAQSAYLGLDDIRITNIKSNFRIGNDMRGLVYAEGTNATTGEAYTHATTTPSLLGFSESGSANDKWDLITEENGNKYIEHVKGTNTKSPITIKDTFNLLDGGAFSYSYDFKWGEGVSSSGAGMLSLKTDKHGEMRIINMGADGGLYFGPATWNAFKITTLTTPKSEGGATWHNIKTVFRPFIADDYIDMNYEFYIDGKLAAYTDIVSVEDDDGVVSYRYNFYTKCTGTWTAYANLKPALRVQSIKDGDTDGDGVLDEGETFAYTYTWIGRSDAYGVHCSWGETADTINRTPMGYWTGFEQVNYDGTRTIINESDVIDTIASIYMFHWNDASFGLDNLKIEFLGDEFIENAEIVGYQINNDEKSVRFIACADSLDFGQIGVDVQVFDPAEDLKTGKSAAPIWTTKINESLTDTVYMALTADGEQIGALEEFGARYFTMLTFTDVDSSANIRLRPYTTKDCEKLYGASVDYVVTFADDKVSVKKADYHAADYSDGFVSAYADNGYCRNKWTSYSWAELSNPNADIGWGGESGSREAALQSDGSIKATSTLVAKSYHKTTVTDPETQATSEVNVKDADGNNLVKSVGYSRRIKFAHVIPVDIENYIGSTFVVTAKVKAGTVNAAVTEKVTVDGVEYDAIYDRESESGKATISFGFMTDYKTTMLSSNEYVISAEDDWVEVQAVLCITEKLLENEALTAWNSSTKVYENGPITDDEGVVHTAPLRPALNLGGTTGYMGEAYIKDLQVMIVPTN